MKFTVRKKKPIPFEFVFEALEQRSPVLKPMFGCWAIYIGEKIVLILREKAGPDRDNGIWVATHPEHHASLRADFPELRSIEVFGPGPTSWQNLPADSDDFEEGARRLCRLVFRGDPRIGKVPASRKKPKGPSKKAGPKTKQRPAKRQKTVSK